MINDTIKSDFFGGLSADSYKYFGSLIENGITTFRVYAPNAENVYVCGDFCKWDEAGIKMKKTDPRGIYEISLDSPKKFDCYKYIIETRDGRRLFKADPYAVHAQTRPETASKVYTLFDYSWNDSEYMRRRALNFSARSPMNIYELNLSTWRTYDDGCPFNYRAAAENIAEYALDMGYTHVELMPLLEYPYDLSWGYQATGYFAVTSRFGLPEDFMYFVDHMHKNGIGVICDWVPAHFAKDAHGLYEFDGSCLYEYYDKRLREHKEWGTRVFDYGKPCVRSFLLSSACHLFDKFHIDGIRVDAVSSMLYLNYGRENTDIKNSLGGDGNIEAMSLLKLVNTTIHKLFPGALTIAEESTAWPMVTADAQYGGLGFDYKWNMGWMNDTLSYMSTDPFFRKGCHNKITFPITYAFSENYILPLSHDEVVHGKRSLIGKMPGEYNEKFANLRAYMAFMYAHPGKKLIFMGCEFAQFIEWNDSRQLDWFLLTYSSHDAHLKFSRELSRFYLANSPLWENDESFDSFSWIACDDEFNNVFSFLRYDKNGDHLVCVFHFSSESLSGYRIGVPEKGAYIEVFTTEDPRFGGSGTKNTDIITDDIPMHGRENSISITIPPFSGIYFKLSSKEKPSDDTDAGKIQV